MARLRTRMSKIKELLRLKFDCHLPNRSISACLNILIVQNKQPGPYSQPELPIQAPWPWHQPTKWVRSK